MGSEMNNETKTWCRRQCEVQHATTDDDFAGMEMAWRYAESRSGGVLTVIDIKAMAEMIDTTANPYGQFRKGPAVFMDGGSSSHSMYIEDNLNSLLVNLGAIPLTPAEFYRELMYIHPFKDGNGRVGALVYNMLNGTINNPVDPPPYK